MTAYSDQYRVDVVVSENGSKNVSAQFGTEMRKVEADATATGTAAGQQFGAGFTAAAGGALTGLAQVAAGLGLGKALLDAGQVAGQAAASVATLNAVLKSTGNTAGTTSGDVEKIAEQLSKTDAIFSGTTEQAAALISSFSAIRNSNSNMFDRVLKDSADLAGLMGTDMVSAAGQLARALQNPQTGLQALSRARVTLTQAERDHVLTLSKEGDLTGAQVALLDIVEKKVTGVAAATAAADPFKRLSNTAQEFEKNVGSDLLPVFQTIATAADSAVNAFSALPPPIRLSIEAAAGFVAISATLSGVARVAGAIGSAFGGGSGAASQAAEIASAEKAVAVAQVQATASAETLTAAKANLASVESSGFLALSGEQGARDAVIAAEETDVGATEELAAAKARLQAAETGAAAGAGSFGLIAGAVALTVGSTIAQLGLLDKAVGDVGRNFRFDTAQQSLTALAETGKVTGLIADTFGEKWQRTKGVFDALGNDSVWDGIKEKIASVDKALHLPGVNAAANDFLNSRTAAHDLASELNKMAQTGGESGAIASAAFDQMRQHIIDAHGDLKKFDALFKEYEKTVKEQPTGPAAALSGAVDLAKGQLADLYTKQAQGETGLDGQIASARQHLADVTRTYNIVQGDMASAQAAAGDAADSSLRPMLDLNGVLSEMTPTTTGVTDALNDFVNGPLAKMKEANKISDEFTAVGDAQKKLNEDFKDLVGTGDKAVAAQQAIVDANRGVEDANRGVADANRQLADAYVRLQDAQDNVTTSIHSLQEAQQALDEYNSPRGAEERTLQLDIINRRVVTTPGEEDQKQLDILKFQDEQKNKQQQLSDSVVNAQKQVRNAYKQVADAQQAISDGEQHVKDSIQRVEEAHNKVAEAAEKARKVQQDAAQAVQADQKAVRDKIIDVETEIINAATKTGQVTEATLNQLNMVALLAGEYGGPLADAIDKVNQKAAIGSYLQSHGGVVGDNWAISPDTKSRLTAEALAGPQSNIPGGDRQLLHGAGVPGFAEGGMVPGSLGAPTLAIVHGGERVLTPAQQKGGGGVSINQHNYFSGDTPSITDLDYANRELGWRLSGGGRY